MNKNIETHLLPGQAFISEKANLTMKQQSVSPFLLRTTGVL